MKKDSFAQKAEYGKLSGLQRKASNIATLRHHAAELFLRNAHMNNQPEATEHVRSIVVGPKHTKQLTMNQEQVFLLQTGRAQTITLVMTNPPKEQRGASTAFTNVGVDYFEPFTVMGEETKSKSVVSSHV